MGSTPAITEQQRHHSQRGVDSHATSSWVLSPSPVDFTSSLMVSRAPFSLHRPTEPGVPPPLAEGQSSIAGGFTDSLAKTFWLCE